MNNDERRKHLDEKLNNLEQKQECELLYDFDESMKEVEGLPYKIKLFGKFYEVPRQMPFSFATFFFRYCYKKVNGKITVDIPEDRLFLFIKLMFGNELLTVLEKSTISLNFVFENVATKILDKWGYGVKQTDTQKKM